MEDLIVELLFAKYVANLFQVLNDYHIIHGFRGASVQNVLGNNIRNHCIKIR